MFSETIVIQAIVNGIVIGSLYLLMAIGFTVVFGLMRIVNFSHAEFYMLGAFICFVGIAYFKLPFIVVAVSAFLLALMFGSLTELSILKRMRGDELSGMITTIGIGMILQSVALIIFGPDPLAVPSVAKGIVRIGGAVLPKARVHAGLFSLLVLLTMYVFFSSHQIWQSIEGRCAGQGSGSDTRNQYRHLLSVGFWYWSGLGRIGRGFDGAYFFRLSHSRFWPHG